VKFSGIAIPNYVFDKNDKLVRSTKRLSKRLSMSRRIAQKKSKRVSVKRGERP
jgi:hypothetical protein